MLMVWISQFFRLLWPPESSLKRTLWPKATITFSGRFCTHLRNSPTRACGTDNDVRNQLCGEINLTAALPPPLSTPSPPFLRSSPAKLSL